jgi:hypothetical protein
MVTLRDDELINDGATILILALSARAISRTMLFLAGVTHSFSSA